MVRLENFKTLYDELVEWEPESLYEIVDKRLERGFRDYADQMAIAAAYTGYRSE